MQRTLRWISCFGLLFAAAAGCGSANQGCLEYAKAVCTQQTQCSAIGAAIYGNSFDICQTVAAKNCELSTHAPGGSWTQDTARSCATAYAAASCDDLLAGNSPLACRPPGSRPVGSACADGFQCQSLYCNRPSAHDCGTCTALPASGDACTPSGVCGYGLECAAGTCSPLRGLGEVCDADHDCKASLGCLKGTCQQSAVGAACDAQYDCNQYQLQYCDGSALTCQPLPYTVAKLGEACGSATDAIIGCPPTSYCKTMGSAAFGVCTPSPTEGQPCAGTSQICASPTTCISGTCQIFDRASCG